MKIEPLNFPTRLAQVEAFTTLRGDVTDGDLYSEHNVCDYTGDEPSHVEACRLSLCQLLGIPRTHLIMPRQTHTARVAVIDSDFLSLGDNDKSSRLQDVDALVTPLSDVVIGVNTADCVPIVLADVNAGIIGAAHAGWKGTKMRIAEATVQAMVALGATPQHIYAAIGASICPDCFEVGDEVVEQFAQAGFPIPLITHRCAATGKAHIHLQEANRLVLTDCGIPAENIAISGRCTRCNPGVYFSARRIGINSGRTFTAIIRRKA